MKRLYLFVLSCILLAIGGMTFNIAILQDADTNPQMIEEASSTGEVSIIHSNEKEEDEEKVELPTEEQTAYERTLGLYGCAEVSSGQKSLAIDEYGICLVYPEEYYLDIMPEGKFPNEWGTYFRTNHIVYGGCGLGSFEFITEEAVKEYVQRNPVYHYYRITGSNEPLLDEYKTIQNNLDSTGNEPIGWGKNFGRTYSLGITGTESKALYTHFEFPSNGEDTLRYIARFKNGLIEIDLHGAGAMFDESMIQDNFACMNELYNEIEIKKL